MRDMIDECASSFHRHIGLEDLIIVQIFYCALVGRAFLLHSKGHQVEPSSLLRAFFAHSKDFFHFLINPKVCKFESGLKIAFFNSLQQP